uniref:Uncharacterized protein n=1 Tax=Panagrolaimus superbus TaxID=310955 RepID=A0A914XRH8_9BILA
METSDKESQYELISLDEKALAAIQLLKSIRKELSGFRKTEGLANEPTASNPAETNAYNAIQEVLPRMTMTPMLSAEIERHKEKLEHQKQIDELKAENKDLKDKVAKFDAENEKIKELKAENKDLKDKVAKVDAEKEKLKLELLKTRKSLKAVVLDDVPEDIQEPFKSLVETRLKKISMLKRIIKETNKDKEEISKELAELKESSKKIEKSSVKLQENELLEYEALLDEPDEINCNPVTPVPKETLDPPSSPTRKRSWNKASETISDSSSGTKKQHSEDDNNKDGIDETCHANIHPENIENRDQTNT